ncbi:MAG: hypothetical protein KY454_01675 [Actinobacteria bacterium]|nr:hypothetical protein [Actinomycetota bacterium]MBW3649714.1 hypothetical protein [Actinomycetota bacterium]
MSPRAVRRVVLAVCVAGIGGMIASSIAGNNGAALTFGLTTAVAVLCLMVATAVSTAGAGRHPDDAVTTDALGAEVEARVEGLVGQGCEEAAVRALVRDAVRFGQALGR